jgi:NTE family protein
MVVTRMLDGLVPRDPSAARSGRNHMNVSRVGRPPRIGLALGSGAARGWSHIGVIRVLEKAGISPSIVCGTSIGALVGAAYAARELDPLETWVRSLTWQNVLGFLDVRFGGGLITGARLFDFFRARFTDPGIAALARTYGAVATEVATGREVWLREGPVLDAVRASIAMPGLFTPFEQDGRLLVDGGLVNPVPVSLCRALGADVVIAVDLNWDLLGRRRYLDPPAGVASMLDVLTASLNIMQVRITRSRLAGEPADAVIRPKLADLALMDFHCAATSIAEGERAATQALPEIQLALAGSARAS